MTSIYSFSNKNHRYRWQSLSLYITTRAMGSSIRREGPPPFFQKPFDLLDQIGLERCLRWTKGHFRSPSVDQQAPDKYQHTRILQKYRTRIKFLWALGPESPVGHQVVSGWWVSSAFVKYVVRWVGSAPVMIYNSWSRFFLRASKRTDVFQEDLTDLKRKLCIEA